MAPGKQLAASALESIRCSPFVSFHIVSLVRGGTLPELTRAVFSGGILPTLYQVLVSGGSRQLRSCTDLLAFEKGSLRPPLHPSSREGLPLFCSHHFGQGRGEAPPSRPGPAASPSSPLPSRHLRFCLGCDCARGLQPTALVFTPLSGDSAMAVLLASLTALGTKSALLPCGSIGRK